MFGAGRFPRITGKRVLAVIAVVVLLVGIGIVAGVMGMPAVAGMENTFGSVDEETTDIESTVVIENPNPFGLGTDAVVLNYSIMMEDVPMASGSLTEIALDRGTDTVELTTAMAHEGITDWWPRHIASGEVTTVDVALELSTDRFDRTVSHTHSTTVETDLLSSFRSDDPRPINAGQPLIEDPVLYINETHADWGTPTETTTPIDMTFLVYNPNPEPYAVSQLGYEITMNEIAVGSGATEDMVVVPGHSTESFDLHAEIDATTLDEWWVTHLDEDVFGHQVSELRIEFWAIVELPTGDEVTIELDPLTYEEFIGTDIFDEGGDVGTTPSDPTGDSEAPDDDPNDDGDDAGTADDSSGVTDDEGADDHDGSDSVADDAETDDDDAGDDADDDTTDDGDDDDVIDDLL